MSNYCEHSFNGVDRPSKSRSTVTKVGTTSQGLGCLGAYGSASTLTLRTITTAITLIGFMSLLEGAECLHYA